MSAYLWKVTAKRAVGNKLPAGAWVEIVKSGTSAPPNQREITQAIESKYGIKIPNGTPTSCFEMIKAK